MIIIFKPISYSVKMARKNFISWQDIMKKPWEEPISSLIRLPFAVVFIILGTNKEPAPFIKSMVDHNRQNIVQVLWEEIPCFISYK